MESESAPGVDLEAEVAMGQGEAEDMDVAEDEAMTASDVVREAEDELHDEQLVEPDSGREGPDVSDLGEVNLFPEPESVPVVEGGVPSGVPRYGLRSARRYGHLHGRWDEREPEQETEPDRLKAGLKKFGRKATESIEKELKSMQSKGVFEPVKLDSLSKTQRKKVIRAFIFLKEKFLPDGTFDKLKARLVAGGNFQDRSLYSDSDFESPTASLQSVLMVAALAALERRKVMTMDIGSAYLNAEMKEEVYLTLEPEIAKVYCEIVPSVKASLNRDGSVTVRLLKALYGCLESAKLWYLHISSKLKKLGFVANQKDECVLNLDYKGKQLTVCLYVDDLLCTCESAEALEWLKDELVKEYKEVNSNVGPVHSYLGMTFDWSVEGKATSTIC